MSTNTGVAAAEQDVRHMYLLWYPCRLLCDVYAVMIHPCASRVQPGVLLSMGRQGCVPDATKSSRAALKHGKHLQVGARHCLHVAGCCLSSL
jgi:hypothetical protein